MHTRTLPRLPLYITFNDFPNTIPAVYVQYDANISYVTKHKFTARARDVLDVLQSSVKYVTVDSEPRYFMNLQTNGNCGTYTGHTNVFKANSSE